MATSKYQNMSNNILVGELFFRGKQLRSQQSDCVKIKLVGAFLFYLVAINFNFDDDLIKD